MELQELYDDSVLDAFIGIAVEKGTMDIKSFRAMLRDYNSGIRTLSPSAADEQQDPDVLPEEAGLTRDCSYYEEYAKEASHAGNHG
jgi:hypothetical protein